MAIDSGTRIKTYILKREGGLSEFLESHSDIPLVCSNPWSEGSWMQSTAPLSALSGRTLLIRRPHFNPWSFHPRSPTSKLWNNRKHIPSLQVLPVFQGSPRKYRPLLYPLCSSLRLDGFPGPSPAFQATLLGRLLKTSCRQSNPPSKVAFACFIFLNLWKTKRSK